MTVSSSPWIYGRADRQRITDRSPTRNEPSADGDDEAGPIADLPEAILRPDRTAPPPVSTPSSSRWPRSPPAGPWW